MTQQLITLNGRTYLQTLDDQGKQIALEGRDPAPVIPVRALVNKAGLLIPLLKAGTATPTQQQQALALTLALLINLSDI